MRDERRRNSFIAWASDFYGHNDMDIVRPVPSPPPPPFLPFCSLTHSHLDPVQLEM